MSSVIKNKDLKSKKLIHYSLNEPSKNKKKKQNIWPITACGVWIDKSELKIKESKKMEKTKEKIIETNNVERVTCQFCKKLINRG